MTMKMRDVIEAGRKASPLVNDGFKALHESVEAFLVMVDDIAMVKSEAIRAVMASECKKMMSILSSEVDDIEKAWHEFDGKLGDYKYKFGRRDGPPKDAPGQMVMEIPGEMEKEQQNGIQIR